MHRDAQAGAETTGRAQVRAGGMNNRAHRQARTGAHKRTRTPTGECRRVRGGEGSRIIEPDLGASYMRTSPPRHRRIPEAPQRNLERLAGIRC